MKLRDFFDTAIAVAAEHDPRGKEAVAKDLEARQKDFGALANDEKDFFDHESLRNPYSDSRILYGTGEEEIKGILVGIDIDVSELLLCERLRDRGALIDLVLAHHPGGRAYATLHDVMRIQADILYRFGVPISIAEDLMEGRMKEVERRLMPVNHTRAEDAARLLGIPLVCLHTASDNMVAAYLQQEFDEKKPYTIAEVLDLLRVIPEYRDACHHGAGPKILIGSKTRKAGRIFVDMTGGTEGSKDIFGSMASSGINTIVAMHLSEEHRKEAEKNHLNVVIAGHISSDNLGLNLLLDEIGRKTGAQFAIQACSGFRRFSRVAC